ncbi:MAG: M24 family metallopeptidase [Candidatus Diapherotrites archaeon]|nr:M24 family metallopeptidase [Candidatus Diapherotrites archaeon]
MYTLSQILSHKKTSNRLNRIFKSVFTLIKHKRNLDELKIRDFVKTSYKNSSLISDNFGCIVAFNENSAFPHYRFDNNKVLRENNLILLDFWARDRKRASPYADITLMAYYGKRIPKEINNYFKIIVKARDEAISFIKDNIYDLPKAKEVDKIARDIISNEGFGKFFIHSTGHSLGITKVHGKEKIGKKSGRRLNYDMLYTIEPGIYFKGKYGLRSEVDILIKKDDIEITTPLQKNIFLIKPR